RARETRARNRVRRRLSTRPHAAHCPRGSLQKKRTPSLLRRVHVSADANEAQLGGTIGTPTARRGLSEDDQPAEGPSAGRRGAQEGLVEGERGRGHGHTDETGRENPQPRRVERKFY